MICPIEQHNKRLLNSYHETAPDGEASVEVPSDLEE